MGGRRRRGCCWRRTWETLPARRCPESQRNDTSSRRPHRLVTPETTARYAFPEAHIRRICTAAPFAGTTSAHGRPLAGRTRCVLVVLVLVVLLVVLLLHGCARNGGARAAGMTPPLALRGDDWARRLSVTTEGRAEVRVRVPATLWRSAHSDASRLQAAAAASSWNATTLHLPWRGSRSCPRNACKCCARG
jgi:hypothetical protein